MKERGWLKSKRARSWLPARNDDRFPTSCGEGTSSTCLLGLSLPCYTTRATRSTLCVYVTRCFEACGLLWPRAANYVLTVNASVNRLTIRLKLSGIFYDFFSSFSLSLCWVSGTSENNCRRSKKLVEQRGNVKFYERARWFGRYFFLELAANIFVKICQSREREEIAMRSLYRIKRKRITFSDGFVSVGLL